jgi:hypothetical protein
MRFHPSHPVLRPTEHVDHLDIALDTRAHHCVHNENSMTRSLVTNGKIPPHLGKGFFPARLRQLVRQWRDVFLFLARTQGVNLHSGTISTCQIRRSAKDVDLPDLPPPKP